MLSKHRSIPVLLCVLALALQSLFVPTAAFAASDYDGVITTGGEFELYLPVNSEGLGRCSEPYLTTPKSNDLGTTWAGYLLDPASYANPTVGAEGAAFWQDLLDNSSPGEGYGWSVSQYTAPSTSPPAGYKTIIITASTTRGAEFTTAYGYKVLRTTGTNTRTYYIDYYSYGNPNIRCDVHIGYWNNYGKVVIANEGNASVEKSIFVNYDIDYPDDYEGEIPPSTYTPPPAKYVAMGDSFSSAEGNPPFYSGTNLSGVNECHRSPQAYPRLLQADSSLTLGRLDFVACSGATTSNVLNGQWNEPAQVDALSLDTEVVTITIGGNDIGFVDYAYACAITLCGPGTFDYGYIMTAINDPDFYDNLVETYETILNQALNAQVYVISYPYLAVEDSDTCGQMDLTGAWAIQSQLNAVIEDAVDDVMVSNLNFNIHYVDANGAGSPFVGKHLCNGGASDFNGFTLPKEYSFHPNQQGQEDYAAIVKAAMS